MKTIILILSAYLLSFNILAGAFIPLSQNNCQKLADIIKAEEMAIYNTDIDELLKRFTLITPLTGGKGGAYVALVNEVSTRQKKVLKIFPTIEQSANAYNYRELYYTCLNGFITFNDLGIEIKPVPPKNNIFPRVYEIGMTNSAEFKNAKTNFSYPYMISEFVEGKSLSSLGEKAHEKPSAIDMPYRLYAKNIATSFTLSKSQSEFVLYQIMHILYKLKNLKIDGKEYGFNHNDLNTGNVMVKGQLWSGTMDAGFGSIKVSMVPMVSFIDFGHSSSNFDDRLGSSVNALKTFYHQKLHIFSASTDTFYKNLVLSDINKASEFFMGLSASNSDVRLYRIMAKAFLDSYNFVHQAISSHLASCKTRTDCVQYAPELFLKYYK